MPFPSLPAFNPTISAVPILGPSSGNPRSFNDPNSLASIGRTIQALNDQAKADTLYDAKPKKEGFTSMPWIVNSRACKREGFMDQSDSTVTLFTAFIGIAGLLLITFSMRHKAS